MKKILYFFIACIAIAFYACKKDSKGNMCWKCTLKMTYIDPDGGFYSTKADHDECDKTEEEIRYYEKARANTANNPDGTKTVTEVACTAK